jgi:hypothetical protein
MRYAANGDSPLDLREEIDFGSPAPRSPRGLGISKRAAC